METNIITDIKNTIELSEKTVEKKLIWRLRMFFAIFVIILGLIIFDISIGVIHLLLASGGIALGVLIGILIGRIFKIRWHEEEARVVARLDTIGTIMLICYFIFAFSRHWIFEHFIHGPALSAFIFCTVSGIMAGRILNMRLNIQKVLREQNIT